MSKYASYVLGVVALSLLLSASVSAAMLARQSGAFGIVTYDPVPVPDAPVFSPTSGTTFDTSLSVSISCPTEGASIYYTTNGVEPTAESTPYRRFRIYGRTTVKAVAVLNGLLSDVAVAEYAMGLCADPVIDAVASFTGSKARVTISCATDGAIVRYTLNGNEPNSHSTRYTGPFDVTNSCTVKAYATKAEYFESAVVTQTIEKVWGIGDTMGCPDQAFSTSGSGGLGWVRVTDATAPNGEAMRSGAITHNQSSVLSTTVTGPGTLSFSWRTSCEADPDGYYEWDHAELVVDGTVVRRLDGVTAWRNESVEIAGEGTHTLVWRYLKDDVESEGEDAAWVAGFGWESACTATQTTDVPVPYAWLRQHDPTVADESSAYEAAAKATAANGRKVWECYALGLDPADEMSDFRIVSIELVDGKPKVEWEPNTNRWTGAEIRAVLKGAATLAGPWEDVDKGDGGGRGATALPVRFFKVVVEMP